MSIRIRRLRSTIDDKHRIRDPQGGIEDMAIYANTLLKTRIPELFESLPGLKGHVEQVQNEVNRLAKIEGLSEEHVLLAFETSRLIRKALKASKRAAVAQHFPCPWPT